MRTDARLTGLVVLLLLASPSLYGNERSYYLHSPLDLPRAVEVIERPAFLERNSDIDAYSPFSTPETALAALNILSEEATAIERVSAEFVSAKRAIRHTLGQVRSVEATNNRALSWSKGLESAYWLSLDVDPDVLKANIGAVIAAAVAENHRIQRDRHVAVAGWAHETEQILSSQDRLLNDVRDSLASRIVSARKQLARIKKTPR